MLLAVGTQDRLLELECHLRDAMDHAVATGMDELSAFVFCSGKLGSPEEFAMQYPQPLTRASRIALVSVQIVWLLGFSVGVFYLLRAPRLSSAHVFSLLLGYWTLLCSMFTGIWILLASKRPGVVEGAGKEFKNLLVRGFGLATVVFSLGTWLGMIWSRENLGVYWSNDPKELVSLVILLVSGACWVLCWRRNLSPRRMASLAMLAFGVMIWCYCLPVYWMFGNLDHVYGYPASSHWYLVGALAVLTLIVSGIGLVGFLPRKMPAQDLASGSA